MSRISIEPLRELSPVVDLSESDRHRLLSNARRRRTLDHLAERALPLPLDDLAADLAAAETNRDVEQVKISLHHHHLPMMDAMGVISYHADSHTVRRAASNAV